MNLRSLLHFLICSLLCFTPFITSGQGLEHLEQYTLSNGLTVILNEDHTRSEVFGYMVCKAGSKDDPADATGMAHYMEHLLFKGTEELGTTNWEKEKPHIDSIFVLYDKLGATKDEESRKGIQELINEQSVAANEYAIPNELDKLLKEIGGTRMNANTTGDRTVYFNTFPPSQMERWLEIYSHRFQRPVFRSFQAELEVVYEEKNRASDAFFDNIFEALMKEAYKKHPYGQQTTLGTIEHLKNPSLTKMKEFFDRWYAPNNMALILCGDFDSKAVRPMIESAFADWPAHDIPEHGTWEEPDFNGREHVEKRMSPVKLGLMCYRTVPIGHPDYFALEVANNLLTNESASGLLDQLASDHELLAAAGFAIPFYDYGTNMFLFVPKIVGQSLDDAEQLMLGKIALLKSGEFEDWRVDAVKRELYRNHREIMESNASRGAEIGEVFARGADPAELKSYPDRINGITKEDVVRVAKAYYGDNYLAFHSKMGGFKGEKIEKPDYEPVVSKTTEKSAFAKHIETVGETPFNPVFINFESDVSSVELKDGVTLYRTENPANDIFSLNIRFNAGKAELPMLEYAVELMYNAYTDTYDKQQVKDEFSKIGASYYFDVDESYTTLSLTGVEADLERALELINELLVAPILDEDEMDGLVDLVKADYKAENAQPSGVANAAVEWVQYGEKSSFIDRLTVKELGDIEVAAMLEEIKKLRGYTAELHYVGTRTMNSLEQTINTHLTFEDGLQHTQVPVVRPVKEYTESQVYFIHKKNAVQSQVHFLQNGMKLTEENRPLVDAFNLYFGGGFSGLVLQEIREYRSLAYTAGASFGSAVRKDTPVQFRGYVGTQADKTSDAIEVFMELLKDMPDKEDRIETIRKYLAYGAISSQPSFRRVIPYVNDMKRLGYTQPPAQVFQQRYNSLAYSDIRAFYEQEVKDKPTVIVVVGDKKKVDVKSLEGYGKLTIVKEKELFRK